MSEEYIVEIDEPLTDFPIALLFEVPQDAQPKTPEYSEPTHRTLREPPPKTVDELFTDLTTGSKKDAKAAAMELAKKGNEVHERLFGMIQEQDPKLTTAAALALKHMDSPEVKWHLFDLLKVFPDGSISEVASKVLVSLGGADVVEEFVKNWKEKVIPTSLVMRSLFAILGHGRLETPKTDIPKFYTLENEGLENARNALENIYKNDPKDIESILIETFTDSKADGDSRINAAITIALLRISTPPVIKALETVLCEKDSKIEEDHESDHELYHEFYHELDLEKERETDETWEHYTVRPYFNVSDSDDSDDSDDEEEEDPKKTEVRIKFVAAIVLCLLETPSSISAVCKAIQDVHSWTARITLANYEIQNKKEISEEVINRLFELLKHKKLSVVSAARRSLTLIGTPEVQKRFLEILVKKEKGKMLTQVIKAQEDEKLGSEEVIQPLINILANSDKNARFIVYALDEIINRLFAREDMDQNLRVLKIIVSSFNLLLEDFCKKVTENYAYTQIRQLLTKVKTHLTEHITAAENNQDNPWHLKSENQEQIQSLRMTGKYIDLSLKHNDLETSNLRKKIQKIQFLAGDQEKIQKILLKIVQDDSVTKKFIELHYEDIEDKEVKQDKKLILSLSEKVKNYNFNDTWLKCVKQLVDICLEKTTEDYQIRCLTDFITYYSQVIKFYASIPTEARKKAFLEIKNVKNFLLKILKAIRQKIITEKWKPVKWKLAELMVELREVLQTKKNDLEGLDDWQPVFSRVFEIFSNVRDDSLDYGLRNLYDCQLILLAYYKKPPDSEVGKIKESIAKILETCLKHNIELNFTEEHHQLLTSISNSPIFIFDHLWKRIFVRICDRASKQQLESYIIKIFKIYEDSLKKLSKRKETDTQVQSLQQAIKKSLDKIRSPDHDDEDDRNSYNDDSSQSDKPDNEEEKQEVPPAVVVDFIQPLGAFQKSIMELIEQRIMNTNEVISGSFYLTEQWSGVFCAIARKLAAVSGKKKIQLSELLVADSLGPYHKHNKKEIIEQIQDHLIKALELLDCDKVEYSGEKMIKFLVAYIKSEEFCMDERWGVIFSKIIDSCGVSPIHSHKLTKTNTPYGVSSIYSCDVCENSMPTEFCWHCPLCNWDACEDCFNSSIDLAKQEKKQEEQQEKKELPLALASEESEDSEEESSEEKTKTTSDSLNQKNQEDTFTLIHKIHPNHKLIKTNAPYGFLVGYGCDVCKNSTPTEFCWHCPLCGWDACEDCMQAKDLDPSYKIYSKDHSHELTRIVVPNGHQNQAYRCNLCRKVDPTDYYCRCDICNWNACESCMRSAPPPKKKAVEEEDNLKELYIRLFKILDQSNKPEDITICQKLLATTLRAILDTETSCGPFFQKSVTNFLRENGFKENWKKIAEDFFKQYIVRAELKHGLKTLGKYIRKLLNKIFYKMQVPTNVKQEEATAIFLTNLFLLTIKPKEPEDEENDNNTETDEANQEKDKESDKANQDKESDEANHDKDKESDEAHQDKDKKPVVKKPKEKSPDAIKQEKEIEGLLKDLVSHMHKLKPELFAINEAWHSVFLGFLRLDKKKIDALKTCNDFLPLIVCYHIGLFERLLGNSPKENVTQNEREARNTLYQRIKGEKEASTFSLLFDILDLDKDECNQIEDLFKYMRLVRSYGYFLDDSNWNAIEKKLFIKYLNIQNSSDTNVLTSFDKCLKSGSDHVLHGNYKEAESAFLEAAQILKNHEALSDHYKVKLYLPLGDLYSYLGYFDESKDGSEANTGIKYFEKALEIYDNNPEIKDTTHHADVLSKLGTAYMRISNVTKAVTYFQLAQKIYKHKMEKGEQEIFDKPEKEKEKDNNNPESNKQNNPAPISKQKLTPISYSFRKYIGLLNKLIYTEIQGISQGIVNDFKGKAVKQFLTKDWKETLHDRVKDDVKATKTYIKYLINYDIFQLKNDKEVDLTELGTLFKALKDQKEVVKILIKLILAYGQIKNNHHKESWRNTFLKEDNIIKLARSVKEDYFLVSQVYYHFATEMRHLSYTEANKYIDKAIRKLAQLSKKIKRERTLHHGKAYLQKAMVVPQRESATEYIKNALSIFLDKENGKNLYYCEAKYQGALIILQRGKYGEASEMLSSLRELLDTMNEDYKKNNQYTEIKIKTLNLLVDCYWNLGSDDEMKKYSQMLSSVADPKDEVKVALDKVSKGSRKNYYVEAVLLNVMVLSRTAKNGSIGVVTPEGKYIAISSETLKKDEIRSELENSVQKKFLDKKSIEASSDDRIKKIVLRNVVIATKKAIKFIRRSNRSIFTKNKNAMKILIVDVMIKLNQDLLDLEKIMELRNSYIDEESLEEIQSIINKMRRATGKDLQYFESHWKWRYADKFGKWETIEKNLDEIPKVFDNINSMLFRKHDEIEYPFMSAKKISKKVFEKFCEEFAKQLTEIREQYSDQEMDELLLQTLRRFQQKIRDKKYQDSQSEDKILRRALSIYAMDRIIDKTKEEKRAILDTLIKDTLNDTNKKQDLLKRFKGIIYLLKRVETEEVVFKKWRELYLLSKRSSPEEKRKTKKERAKEIAAWVEYRVNLMDHFYTDSCSRLASVLSAIVCYVGDCKVPVFLDREDYYQHAPKRPFSSTKVKSGEVDRQQNSWTEYYVSHFPDLEFKVPPKPDIDYFGESLENLKRISRYIGGNNGTSASGYTNKASLLEGSAPAMVPSLAIAFGEQIRKSITVKDKKSLETLDKSYAAAIQDYIKETAENLSIISNKKEQNTIFRIQESKHYNFEASDILSDFELLLQDVSILLTSEKPPNMLIIGAMIYYRIAMVGQYFSDGNKRVALALETVLFKHVGHCLPKFYSNSIWNLCNPVIFYNGEKPTPLKEMNEYITDARFLRWYYGYSNLFLEHIMQEHPTTKSSSVKDEQNAKQKSYNQPLDAWNVEDTSNPELERKSTIYDIKNIYEEGSPYEKLKKLETKTGLDVRELIAWKPERMLLHSIIVIISTRYRVPKHKFQEVVTKVKEMIEKSDEFKALEDKFKDKYVSFHEYATRKIREYSYSPDDNCHEFNVINELKSKIYSHDNKQQSRLRVYEAEEVLAELLAKSLLRLEYYYKINNIVKPILDTYATQPGEPIIHKMTLRSNNRRRVWVLSGGAASGKSTASETFILKNTKDNDYCNVNPDLIKPLLLDIKKEPNHASRTHSESSYIKGLIVKELEAMIQHRDDTTKQIVGHAPDILLDAVAPDAKKFTRLFVGNPRVFLYTVSCDAETAVRRSYERASKEYNERGEKNPDYQRYVPTKIVLEGHKEVSQTLSHNLASDAFYSAKIMSTNEREKITTDEKIKKLEKNISKTFDSKELKSNILKFTEDLKSKHRGEIASYDKKTLLIINTKEFWRFLRKSNLNTRAYNEQSLYAKGIGDREEEYINPKMWIQSIDEFISKGIKLNFLGHTTLSTRGLHSEDLDELLSDLKEKKLKALITYSVEKSVNMPFKSQALPVLRNSDGSILSVFSPEINNKISGISMEILQILVGKVTNQQFNQFGSSSLSALTENVKRAFISSGIALSNQEVIMVNLPKMVSKAMTTKLKVEHQDDRRPEQ